jgi:hypothetical protein
MHLFLVRRPGADAFAHLHPQRTPHDKSAYATALPALPPGDYDLYADITHESGLTQTLTNTVQIPAVSEDVKFAATMADADDSVDTDAPQKPGDRTLPDGFMLKPVIASPIRANEETTLRFDLTNPDGTPAPLEPFLGMYGHLLIQHEDGSVFTHLHPLGSISMEAQRRYAEREHAGYLASQPLDLLCAPPSRTLSFPYAFPKPGNYRLWLQTKLQGRVRTAAYEINVE